MPCNLRTTQGGQGSFNHLLRDKPEKGNASNVRQLATEMKMPERDSCPCPLYQQTGHWKWKMSSVPKGRGASTPKIAMLDDWGGQGILVAPTNEMSISTEELQVVLDVAGRIISFSNWFRSYLFCPDLSHWASFLQKLYCDRCWQKTSHSFLHLRV